MDLEDLAPWAEAFAAYCARFDDLLARSESRQQAHKYLRGLVAPLERKTSWQLAELVRDTTPDRMQRLLYRVAWDADAARDRLDQFVIERFGDADGIGVLDKTGIPKKGTRSVGVAQQYCGAVGKLANCQVATLLTYARLASPRGHVFVDRPPVPAGGVVPGPAAARARSCPGLDALSDQGAADPRDAGARLGAGGPLRWVTGDSVYAESTPLRQASERAGKWYVLAVTSVTRVWSERPALRGPAEVTGGRPRRSVRLAPGAPKAQTVAAVVAPLPRQRGRRLSVGAGAKGARSYAWACLRLVESRDDLPGPEGWLLARRSVSQPDEIAY